MFCCWILLSYGILCYHIPSLEVKAQLYFVSSSYMLLHKKTLFKIWLNPGLNVTIFRGTALRSQNKKNIPHFILYKLWCDQVIRKLHFLSNLTHEHISGADYLHIYSFSFFHKMPKLIVLPDSYENVVSELIADWLIINNGNMTDVLHIMLKCCGGF